MQQVFYTLNRGLSYIEMEWPSPELYAVAGKTGWARKGFGSSSASATSTDVTAAAGEVEIEDPSRQRPSSSTLTAASTTTTTSDKDWEPKCGTEGVVIHRWVPNHAEAQFRTNYSMPILLIECEDDGHNFYVPVGESGAVDLGAEV